MSTCCTSGLVLRTYDFSEADRVIVLFTRERGKVRGIAKGVRRSRSRLAACLGWLSLSELQLYGKETRELMLVTQGQLENAFPGLKTDLTALGQAARICELVDGLTPERQPLPGIFNLLMAALGLLETGVRPSLAGTWFEVGLLNQLGYRPVLQTCQLCQCDSKTMAYHVETGGVVCRACRPAGGISISPGARRLLERLIRFPADKVQRLHLHHKLQGEITALLDAAVHYQLGRKLKSDIFRQAVAKLEG